MKKYSFTRQDILHFCLLATILLVGFSVRLYQLDTMPGGINQDEAFSFYEAYSIFTTGKSAEGYVNPVYLPVWGSGQSALNSYLMVPLLALFGNKFNSTFITRLPQATIACLTLVVVYLLLKKLLNRRFALLGTALIAVFPWHVMMSRWGLDCNLAPGFLIFGLYFFVLGLEKPVWLLASAAAYGLSLYCYATIWPIAPLILVLQIAYGVYFQKLSLNRYTVLSVVILGLLALPLLLFVLVNNDILPEIILPFLSIPKLPVSRMSEISFSNISQNAATSLNLIITQSDGLIWNVIPQYGLYYLFTTPFALFGVVRLVVDGVKSFRTKAYKPQIFILVQIVAALCLAVLISVHAQRINCLHIPLMLCAAVGIYYLPKDFRLVMAMLYCISFFSFTSYYFGTAYRDISSSVFLDGYELVLTNAQQRTDGNIYIPAPPYAPFSAYSRILFYTKMPPEEFRETIRRSDSEYEVILALGRYVFYYPEPFKTMKAMGDNHMTLQNIAAQLTGNTTLTDVINPEDTYIVYTSEAEQLRELGMQVDVYNQFALAYCP